MALSSLMVVRTFDGDLDSAEDVCDDIDAILSITGHPLPLYGRIFVAAYRGQVEEVEQRAKQLRADAYARGEGYALTVANMAEALVYNGAGRYAEALASAREEMPYTHELGHAMRTLLEVVEAATRTGEFSVAEEAVERLTDVTRPVGDSHWALAVAAMATAQVSEDDQAEILYQEAIQRFDRIRVPMLKARSQLLYGEMLRRAHRRVDARLQLRAAFEGLSACGMNGFADRAQRELRATGETVRTRRPDAVAELTDQELTVARLARDGLTNRDIGARLFISAHTAEWHLRKVFTEARHQIPNRAQRRPRGAHLTAASAAADSPAPVTPWATVWSWLTRLRCDRCRLSLRRQNRHRRSRGLVTCGSRLIDSTPMAVAGRLESVVPSEPYTVRGGRDETHRFGSGSHRDHDLRAQLRADAGPGPTDPGSQLIQQTQPGLGQRGQRRAGGLRLQPAGRPAVVPSRVLPDGQRLDVDLVSAPTCGHCRGVEQRRKRITMTSLRYVQTDLLDIGYHERGPATGPPVILLHGYPYDIHSYVDVAPLLARAGQRVIVPYLRGHGPTRFRFPDTPRSGQQAALGADVIALMDALGLPRAVLAGYDWGGRAACVAAALQPDRVAGLVSVNGYLIQDIAAAADPLRPDLEAGFWYFFYFLTERGRAGLTARRREVAEVIWRRNSPRWAFTDDDLDRAAEAFDNPDYVDVVIHSYRHRLGHAAGAPAYAAAEAALAQAACDLGAHSHPGRAGRRELSRHRRHRVGGQVHRGPCSPADP